MMTGLVARAWQTVKPHVPLIKFRKGGNSAGHSPAIAAAGGSPSAGGPSGKSQGGAVSSAALIEDWQLPPRYRRANLDQQEIDAINSGGAI